MASDESTPLRNDEPERSYVYMSARNRSYRSKVRQFQCCVCAGLLGSFVVAMIVTVSYMVNHDTEDEPMNTTTVPPPMQQQAADLHTLLTATWPRPDSAASSSPALGDSEVSAALEAGVAELRARDAQEEAHPTVPLPPAHPSSLHRKAMYSSPAAGQAARVGQIELSATQTIARQRSGWSWGRGRRLPPTDKIRPEWCPAEDHKLDCPPSPYRSIDGKCNNLRNPEYGVAMRPFRRGLPPDYADGVSAPRVAHDGGALPNAREVSLTVHRPMYRNDPHFTVVLAVWGQFVDHDFTATALSQRSDGSGITCCNSAWQHPECFPVEIQADDPFNQQYNVTCIDFVRSAPAPSCSLGPREQLNQVTPYIDGSVVYGGNGELADSLRTFEGGLLTSSHTLDGRELLPVDTQPGDGCNQEKEAAKGRYCFRSGDARANENLHLTTLHLVLARQHNRLAHELARMNPSWDDERLYQEARRIVAAQMQHVTFNEFLPIVIGQDLADKLDLSPKKSGYYHGYDPSVNSQIANEFASCAFRFGHTLLQGLLKMIGNDSSSEDYVQLHKMFFNPFGLYDAGYMARTVRGALHTNIQRADPYFSTEVSQRLFQLKESANSSKAGPCGLDLVSLNVQRGRDHGLQGYPAWRQFCGLSRPASFEDLEPLMDSGTVSRLRSLYRSVEDIDLYTGVVSETPMHTLGLLGPTATCIIADQFVHFKRGDRYWYETPEKPQAFTPAQLDELRKTTLSSLLCDNTDSLDKVQPYSMRAVSQENPLVACSELSRPDFSPWAEPSRRVRLVSSAMTVRAAAPPLQPGKKPKPTPTSEDDYHHFVWPNLESATGATRQPPLAVGASVISGNITGSYRALDLLTLWDGKLPAPIPFPFFDDPLPKDILSQLDVHEPRRLEYRGFLLWGGSIQVLSNDTLKLSANYHLPITPPGVGNKSERRWWCGEAELLFRVNWNTTELHDLPLTNYFTPLAFKKVEGSKPAKTFLSVFQDQSAIGLLQARVDREALDPATLPRMPLLLSGSYSEDNTKFLWNGDITIIYPKVVPEPPPPVLMASGSPARHHKAEQRLSIGATVVSGNITGSYRALDLLTLWDGNLPAPIPFPFFDAPLPRDILSQLTVHPPHKVEYRGGLLWGGSVEVISASMLRLSANYHLPITPAGVGNKSERRWWCGEAELLLQVNWNSSELYDLPLTNYFTPLAFKIHKGKKTPQGTILNIYEDQTETGMLMARVDRAPLDPHTLPRIPLLLSGHYSADNTIFWWDGDVTITYPKVTPPAPLLTVSSRPQRFWFRGSVTSGSVTLGVDSSSWWDGTIPFQIPVQQPVTARDLLHGSDVLLSLSSSSSASSVTFRGDFSAPMSSEEVPGMVQWQEGKFEVSLQLTSSTSSPLPDVWSNIFCSLILHNGSSSADIPDSEIMLTLTPGTPETFTRAFVVLNGYYSKPDEFTWTGGVSVIIKPSKSGTTLPNPTPMVLPPPPPMTDTMLETSWRSSSRHLVVGASVISGAITGSYSLGPLLTLWDGTFPAAIPAPFLDFPSEEASQGVTVRRVKSVEHVGGALWGGSVTVVSARTLKLSANYHLPIATASKDQKWWCGEVEIELAVNWNSSELHGQEQGDFFTPIGLKRVRQPDITAEVDFVKLFTEPLLQVTVDRAPLDPHKIPRFPLLLEGTYNEDNSVFWWNGNITMIFPREMKTLQQPNSRENNFKKLAFGGTAVSGSISMNDGTRVWDGSLPQDMVAEKPVPHQYVKLASAMVSATFSRPEEGRLDVSANLSAPVSHSGTMVDWEGGSLTASLQLAWDTGFPQELLEGTTNLFCLVFLRDTPALLRLNRDDTPDSEDILVLSPGTPKIYAQMILVLEGQFTENKFSWNGDMIGVIQPREHFGSSPHLKAAAAAAPGRRLVLGGKVSSGSVTAYSDNAPRRVWFEGSFPVSIPRPMYDRYLPPDQPLEETTDWSAYRTRGLLWTGSIEPRPEGRQVEVYGDFRVPLFLHAGSRTAIEWWQGHLELVVDVAWNSSALRPVASSSAQDFFSPLRLRADERPQVQTMEAVEVQDMEAVVEQESDMMQTAHVLAESGPFVPRTRLSKLPIILHGSTSPDRSAFLWSGNITIVFPWDV